MIIRGGENIQVFSLFASQIYKRFQPTEIENFINENPDIESCYVVGVPSKRLGEEVAAYIRVRARFLGMKQKISSKLQLHEGKEMTIDELKSFASTGLARYKIPKFVKFVTEYPLTNTGKVQKFKLRDGAADDFDLDQ